MGRYIAVDLGATSGRVALVDTNSGTFDINVVHRFPHEVINNEELNYLPMSQAVMREAKFIYNYYTIETASNINAFIAEAGAGVQAPTPVLPSELDTRILV